MRLYLVMDDSPERGYYSAFSEKPDLWVLPNAREVRGVDDFPEEVWRLTVTGGLPVDEDDTNDTTWVEWWSEARRLWSRD